MRRGQRPKLVIELSDEERQALETLGRKRTALHCEVQRARAVLMAANGERNVVIAEAVGIDSRTVSIWRKEFLERRMDCLRDRARAGRPGRFSPSGQSCGHPPGLPSSE